MTNYNYQTDQALDQIKDNVADAFISEAKKTGTFTEEQLENSKEKAIVKDYKIIISIPVEMNGSEGTMDVTLEKRKKKE